MATSEQVSQDPSSPPSLVMRYGEVRRRTEALAKPLTVEDQLLQSMPDASPTKWHLAHTTWFFEAFCLQQGPLAYEPFHERFSYLFNSYYESVGPRHARPRRGMLSRPGVEEVRAYRGHVDEAMTRLLEDLDPKSPLGRVVEVGLHHEEQHQELLLTDIKHAFYQNPLRPIYQRSTDGRAERGGLLGESVESLGESLSLAFVEVEGGIYWVGHDRLDAQGREAFAFDNESPRHEVLLRPFAIANRLVTCGEFMEFIADGGYDDPRLWLSDGWEARTTLGFEAPLYWERADGRWMEFTLQGTRSVAADAPVCHVSFYEADAFARWASAQDACGRALRLATEFEWEAVASRHLIAGNFAESQCFHPLPRGRERGRRTKGEQKDRAAPAQLYGDVWEWTASPYVAYPGYRAWEGALGEYNEKFMCNQFVLRGGSCVTPSRHIRSTYRNFFAPQTRWQFCGFRLAR